MALSYIAVTVLNKVLGKYIKDLDSENLELKILSGEVELIDLELREDALDDLDLPIEVIKGYVGKIELKIPWTDIYSQPCEVSLHDVYVVAGPVKGRKYNVERAKAAEVSSKRKRLKKIEEARRRQRKKDTKHTEKQEDSFFDKLIAQVLKNLQVSVGNIHFRYEDKVTSDRPFVFGVTLSALSAETTDEFWRPTVVEASVQLVHKLVSLEFLSVYWNTQVTPSAFCENARDWKNQMCKGISRKGYRPENFQYILKPLSAESHLIMDQTTQVVLDTPKMLIEVIQQELSVILSQIQFQNMMELIDSLQLMIVNEVYRKYQPDVPVKKNPKAWWQYSFTAVCEEKIRSWSWQRIKAHRAKYRKYKTLYKMKLRGLDEHDNDSVLSRIQELEDDLDIPTILVSRQHARLEVASRKLEHKEAKEGGGWWEWFGFGGGSHEESRSGTSAGEQDVSLMNRLSVSSLPVEEKEKLYAAIDYSENSVPIIYPQEYVKRRLTFNLDSCTVTLTDLQNREVAQVVTDGFEAALEQRPGSKAIRFSAKVNSFKVFGCENEGAEKRSCLVTSQNPYTGKGKELMLFTFETNPINVTTRNVTIDYLVSLSLEPVEVTYDDKTVEGIVKFFTLQDNSGLKQIEAAAVTKLEELKSWTRAGLEYAISQHKITYIVMDVRSPYIVVPEYGSLERNGSVLIFDLGRLKVVSDLASRNIELRELSNTQLEKMFYDKFNVTLSEVQILLADKSSDWRDTHKQTASKAHILPSCGLELQLYRSISADYPDKPEFKVTSVAPSLHLRLSDKKLKQLMKFMKTFPLGNQNGDQQLEQTNLLKTKELHLSSSRLSLAEANDIQELVLNMRISEGSNSVDEENSEDDDVWFDAADVVQDNSVGKTSQLQSKTKLSTEFTIGQLLVTLEKESSQSEQPYLSFAIKKLSTEVVVCSWDLSIEARLGFISLVDNNYTDVDGSPLQVFRSSIEKDWILVTYKQADPEGPQFDTKFNSVAKSVLIKFASLNLTAKQEAIASFQEFVLEIFHSLGEQPTLSIIKLPLEMIPENDQLDTKPRPLQKASTDGKGPTVHGMQIKVELNAVSLTLSASGRHVGKVNIGGLMVDVHVQENSTVIATKLKDFGVYDVTEDTLYPEILTLDDNQLFDCKVTLFNKDAMPSINDHTTAPDVNVQLRLGRMRFVFLNRFFAYIQNFIHALASSNTTAYAQDVTTQVIKAQAKHLQSQGTKIGLNITIRAPTLVVPCYSQSRDMLVADLGHLQVTNCFTSSNIGLFEDMHVDLRSFQVKGISDQPKHLTDYIVEPVRLDLRVKRKLHSVRKNTPFIDVVAKLELVKVNLTIDEYKMVMKIVAVNLQEGEKALVKEEPVEKKEESVKTFQPVIGEISRDIPDAMTPEEEESTILLNLTINKVTVNSPAAIDTKLEPYLVLDITELTSSISIQRWTFNVNASLGAISLLDMQNKGSDGDSLKLLKSVEHRELIKVEYKKVDPQCPEFETTYCSVDQTVKVELAKVKVNCLQKAVIDLEEHFLSMTSSENQMKVTESIPQRKEDLPPATTDQNSTSVKIEANLDELEVNIETATKPVANVQIKGLRAELLLWAGGLVVKSEQRDLSVTDLDPKTIYPKIVSVENEGVFNFVFKYCNQKETDESLSDSAQLTRADGSLELNVERINVVFLYRFINEVLLFVQPLVSPKSTKYVQDATQRTVAAQVENIQQQGTRINLNVNIQAPLVVMPRHSKSVEMLIADLGHLKLQNEFAVFELSKDGVKDKDGDNEKSSLQPFENLIAFDVMDLNLQSVQLSRGIMDVSSSAVTRRHLLDPIQLDATIHRSLKPSCHTVPAFECKVNIEYVKVNLGHRDYQLLTKITQENLNEGQVTEPEIGSERVSAVVVEHVQSLPEAEATDSEGNPNDGSTPYITMLFSLNLQGASVTLYTHEKDLDPFDSASTVFDHTKALCCCQVGSTSLTLELPSDKSVHIHGQFLGLILEDIRAEGRTEFPRLLDKKFGSYASSVTSSKEMCEVWFRQNSYGKMNLEVTLQNAAIYVNLPFITPLLEFFTTEVTSTSTSKIEPRVIESASQTSVDAGTPPDQNVIAAARELEGCSRDVTMTVAAITTHEPGNAVTSPSAINLEIHGIVKDSDIVFLGDPLKKESSGLILQSEVNFVFTMLNENQQFVTNLTNLQMISCVFPDVLHTSHKVLRPCSVEFSYRVPGLGGKGLELEVDVKPMKFELSPAVVSIVLQVINSISGKKKVEESSQTVGGDQALPPSELWAPRRATREYWYQRKAVDESKPRSIIRKTTGEKFKLTSKEIQIVIMDEFEGSHIPALLVTSHVSAKAADWSSQMTFESDLQVKVSYYNDKFATWEPLLEPEMINGESSMWGLQLTMFKADGYLSSFSPDITKSGLSPPSDLTDGAANTRRRNLFGNSKVTNGKRKKSSHLDRLRRSQGGTKSDETDLDGDGTLQHGVASSSEVLVDFESDDAIDDNFDRSDDHLEVLDEVDGPGDETSLEAETKPQAVYVIVNSHDKMQLTITPVALDVVKRLTEVMTSDAPEKRTTPSKPKFIIKNKLGIHVKVSVSAKQRLPVLEGGNITLNKRKAMLEVGGTTADVVPSCLKEQRKRGKKLLSEPLFDRFRERVEKMKRKRASLVPVAVEAGNVKILNLKSPTSSEEGRKKKSQSADANAAFFCSPSESTTSLSAGMASLSEEEGRSLSPISETQDDENCSDTGPREPSNTTGLIGQAVAHVGAIAGQLPSLEHATKQIKPKRKAKHSEEDNYISITVDGFDCVQYVPMNVGGQFWYQLQPIEGQHHRFIIVQLDMRKGHKIITIRAPLQFKNHLDFAIEILIRKDKDAASNVEEYSYVTIVEPGKSEDIPLEIAHEKELFIRPLGYEVCSSPIFWKAFTRKAPSRIISSPSIDDHESLSIKVFCQWDTIDKDPVQEDAPHHVIHLYPPLIIHNLLPVQFSYETRHNHSEATQAISPGSKSPLSTVENDGSCQMIIKVDNYRGHQWNGILNVWKEMPKSSQIVLKCDEDDNRDLVVSTLLSYSGTAILSIFSPYWLINKTGLSLDYKMTQTKETHHQNAADDCPLMLSYRRTHHRKARLRVGDSSWSDKFSLDAVGDIGQLSCNDKHNERKYEFVLEIEMSRTGLTKIVTVTPKYVVINKTRVSLSYQEVELENAFWFVIEAGETAPFWPISKSKKIFVKPTLSVAASKAVDYDRATTTVLRMPDIEAICVDVQGEEEGSILTIVFSDFSSEIGTIRVENLCDDISIQFSQRNVGQVTVLRPSESILYTWDDPNSPRRIEWKSYDGVEDSMEIIVDQDSCMMSRVNVNERNSPNPEQKRNSRNHGYCSPCQCIRSSEAQEGEQNEAADEDETDGLIKWGKKTTTRNVYVMSLLDGLQRVVMFTDDENLVVIAQQSSESEVVTMEIFVSLDGVGLSLVNSKPEEISYITFSSSSSVWQVGKSERRWKTLNLELSSWLEDAWNNVNVEKAYFNDKAEVDFSTMRMIKPYNGPLRRLFEPGVWMRYSSSERYQSFHCKMFRIQVDNQLYTTVFPVAFYPTPLPAAVTKRTGPKPFIEVSVVYHNVPNSDLLHFKYARALVQEMNVKLDKGFIIALSTLFTSKDDLSEEEKYFSEDMKKASLPLKESKAVTTALETQRVFLENFHLSPLKVNLSFSLISELDKDEDQKFTEDLLDFFVDSIGATLTEINDVQLKLGYFERTGAFVTPGNLLWQIAHHYKMQGIRQVYVLVLGLDVLGNPYGLISGIGEGVRDLFYEPYQGFVEGPQEFAEGIARGVRSLLGHTVGGTAGAMSRITGSIGQAIATLTFDSDYRKNRRRLMHREPRGFGQGVAMGGKSLAMGLFFGISGVVMKPIEGAQSEGVEGFFKGIGKGLLGLLLRPTGGVIDMVSFTLDGIRRSAEQGGEDIVYRMRIPRFTSPNMPLKPFSERAAQGYGILKSLPHSFEVYHDVYVFHAAVDGDEAHHLVLLTNRRVMFLHQTTFWKEWSMDWSVFYENIENVRVSDDVLFITENNNLSDLPRVRELHSEDQEILHELKEKIRAKQNR